MLRDLIGIAAKFRQHQRQLSVALQLQLPEIDMAAVHVGILPAEPAGGGIDPPGIVQLTQLIAHGIAVKLTPAFIEDGPVDDAGMVLQLMNGCLHGCQELLSGTRIPVQVLVLHPFLGTQGDRGQHRVPEIAVITVVHHVLKYHHTKLVALIIEFLRLHLNVLAQGVETQALHGQDIIGITFRGGGGKEAVGPVALIQQAVEEIGLSIQAQPGPVPHFFDFQSPQGKIGLHPVLPGFHREFVQVRILRTPEPGMFRGDGDTAAHQRVFLPMQDHPALQGGPDGNGDGSVPIFNIQLFNMGFRHAFQPHRLPDAGDGGVPHAAPLFRLHLLSVGLPQIVQVIPAEDLQLVFLLQGIGNVHGEGFVAAVMLGQQPLVHIHHGMLVHRADVQQHPSPVKAFRQGEAAAVGQDGTLGEMLLHPGQGRLRAEGHPDGTDGL